MEHFINYLKDTVAELKHVSWPTQHQAMNATILVVLISTFVALFIALFDHIFGLGLQWFTK